MDAIAAVLVALLSTHIPSDFECNLVTAGPDFIEMFCDKSETNKLWFVLIERTGMVVVDGLSL